MRPKILALALVGRSWPPGDGEHGRGGRPLHDAPNKAGERATSPGDYASGTAFKGDLGRDKDGVSLRKG